MNDSRLRELKARAEAARGRYETEAARLFRPDGSRVYADAEHAERLGALRAERNEALGAIEEETERALNDARGDIEALENAPMLAHLKGGEALAQANAAYPLAVADLRGLGNREERIKRLRAVRRAGDDPTRVAFALAARAEASGAGLAEDLTLRGVLAEMEAEVAGEGHRQNIADANERVRGAAEIKGVCWLARHEQSSPYEPRYSVSGATRG
jgi:hypothetical protein